MKVLLLPLLILPLLAACSLTSRIMSPAPESTLSDLEPVRLPKVGANLPQVSLKELETIYRQVLAVTDDPATRIQVLHRLADLQMLQGEEALARGETAPAQGEAELAQVEAELAQAETELVQAETELVQAEVALSSAESEKIIFSQAVIAYQSLLERSPNGANNDKLLYQMSKAYDLNQDPVRSALILEQLSQQHPQSSHYVEAKFRVAESHFSAGKYKAAELAYQQVTERGEETGYYRNALYMRGWAQFKQARYEPAIESFSLTLDLLLPADNMHQELPRGEHELVQDSFRVLAVIFSTQDGPATIASAYAELGYRPYNHLLYRHLGELYLQQQRYRDSAETYRTFIQGWPDSDYAHEFQISVIKAYESGGFPDLIVAEKQNYVEAYGVGSDYWLIKNPAVGEAMEPTLKLYIEELATYYHALAQSVTQAAGKKTGKQADSQLPALAVEHYRVAAGYYQLFIDSFSNDVRVPELAFLMAESRWESGDVVEAISVYEWVAYDFPNFDKAADAGYAAILGYDRQLASAAGTNIENTTAIDRSKIDSQKQFVSVFARDGRAPLVLKDAADSLMELAEYQQAIEAATMLLDWQPVPAEEVLIPARLIVAHSHFELGEFADAEQSYLAVLARMPATDKRRAQAVERVAASVYRQAEAAVAAADFKAAADQFARVLKLAPTSSIRVQAQYDAAVNYTAAAEFALANSLLIDFRQRFPQHKLTADVAVKLAHNYEQLQQWGPAAQELDKLEAVETDPERKRQLHYIAAEYYDQAGNLEQARLRYRSYANSWMQPAAVRFEAMNRLAELYAQANIQDKRRFWLRKIMKAHDTDVKQQSERSRYLAAGAASVLAEDEFLVFQDIEIRYPMANSLKKKRASMKKALGAYQKTYDYGVSQFSTQATYKMGEVFRDLSEDLLNSERPGNIDDLALEQYEVLLEEQAFPFEEKAISIHESNARRSWEGLYDQWVQRSFTALALLLPARYAKTESGINYSQEIY